jgi:delta 1-pyrroline-5-carboxylate dehydrogenase
VGGKDQVDRDKVDKDKVEKDKVDKVNVAAVQTDNRAAFPNSLYGDARGAGSG